MAKTQLYSVAEGKLVDFKLEQDRNGDIVATSKNEVLKFPGGLTKAEFTKLVNEHNEANEGVKALTEEEVRAEEEKRDKTSKLLESLE